MTSERRTPRAGEPSAAASAAATPPDAPPQSTPAESESVLADGRRPGAAGPEVIEGYWRTLPNTPGVYRMIDAAGEVIYVGKARSLKARVASYTRLAGHTNRIARMILATTAMEFVTVRTEAEALLLEANLIKRFRPRFNVLMRDDKSFPYILIRTDHASPQILKHRGARTGKGHYFGPFASAGAVNRTITMLQRAFLIRTCSDSVFESRTRPCLLHQIKRCAGPCTGEIPAADYDALVGEAVRFLKGESQNVRDMYRAMMEAASERLEFETAAKFRNRLWALAHVTADQSINPDGVEEADVFAAVQEGGQTCIQVFFFRSGQNWGNRAYYPKADRSLEAAAVLESFIAQFYDDKPVPRLILASEDFESRQLMEEALSLNGGRRVEIRVPQRGAKSALVEHATTNARDALGRRLAETSSQAALLAGLADRFGLVRPPRRVEVYDNSHIQGSNAVGAMIVAGAQGFAKAHYRRFNMRSAAGDDDYAMMREMLTRRLKRIAGVPGQTGDDPAAAPGAPSTAGDGMAAASGEPEDASKATAILLQSGGAAAALPGDGDTAASRIEAPAPPPLHERGSGAIAFGALRAVTATPIGADGREDDDDGDETLADVASDLPEVPDLLLIDGGAGQLRVASEVLAELGLEGRIAMVGVAKGPDRDAGREHFHIPGRPRSFMLEPRDPVLYFVQRLRDEAHRFAIGSHRAKRAKAISSNPLDEIDGIGPTRKRALLSHFGSAKSVSRAGVEDLKAVKGISAEMAQKIYDFFHERRG